MSLGQELRDLFAFGSEEDDARQKESFEIYNQQLKYEAEKARKLLEFATKRAENPDYEDDKILLHIDGRLN